MVRDDTSFSALVMTVSPCATTAAPFSLNGIQLTCDNKYVVGDNDMMDRCGDVCDPRNYGHLTNRSLDQNGHELVKDSTTPFALVNCRLLWSEFRRHRLISLNINAGRGNWFSFISVT